LVTHGGSNERFANLDYKLEIFRNINYPAGGFSDANIAHGDIKGMTINKIWPSLASYIGHTAKNVRTPKWFHATHMVPLRHAQSF
jgi:hypothetical protein